jgi:hypothetical protein
MKNEEEVAAADTPSSTSSFLPRTSNLEPRWNRLYALVIGELALTILIFYLFTKAFQ